MFKASRCILIACICIAGCYDIYSPGRLHRTVKKHPQDADRYVVIYRYLDVIEKYGPGLKKVRYDVEKQKGLEEKNRVWDNALSVAVPRYLETRGLIPSECADGVLIVSHDTIDEGGNGMTLFKCKAA